MQQYFIYTNININELNIVALTVKILYSHIFVCLKEHVMKTQKPESEALSFISWASNEAEWFNFTYQPFCLQDRIQDAG
jgi:hypothetical protein